MMPDTELVNRNFAAGLYQLDFDVSSVSIGVDLYIIQAKGIDDSNYIWFKKIVSHK
jgi:hypothetical protein